MKLENFPEIKWIISKQDSMNRCMSVYRQDHPYFKCFDFPGYFYFKIYNDRLVIHWAVIRKEENWSVYFISMRGRAFDKLEFKTKKQAQRALRRNKFYFSTNKYCPYKPISPIYINLGEGEKSAPYSKGNLWQKVQRNSKQSEKFQKTYAKIEENWLNKRNRQTCRILIFFLHRCSRRRIIFIFNIASAQTSFPNN